MMNQNSLRINPFLQPFINARLLQPKALQVYIINSVLGVDRKLRSKDFVILSRNWKTKFCFSWAQSNWAMLSS